jgi:hypothetical protein
MKKSLTQNKIMVKKSRTHGYGVFACKNIQKGEVIEECYVLIVNGKDKKLEDYYFDANGKYALLTGYGIIYNHSEDENAIYYINNRKKLATIKARRKIKKGDEIFISYGEKWFKDRGITPKGNEN